MTTDISTGFSLFELPKIKDPITKDKDMQSMTKIDIADKEDKSWQLKQVD
jgi:hypothetical protein